MRDTGGFPAPRRGDGKRAMPFWSKRSRAQHVVDKVAAYAGFALVSIPIREWTERWLPGLEKDGCMVGLIWSGPRATGYDLPADEARRRLGELLRRVTGPRAPRLTHRDTLVP